MTLTLDQLADRLHACEVDLEAHRAYLKALEYALGTLIATHHDPRQLLRGWNVVLADAVDAHAGGGGNGAVFTAAFQQALRTLNDELDCTALAATSAHQANR